MNKYRLIWPDLNAASRSSITASTGSSSDRIRGKAGLTSAPVTGCGVREERSPPLSQTVVVLEHRVLDDWPGDLEAYGLGIDSNFVAHRFGAGHRLD
jgi:hypothetical protein